MRILETRDLTKVYGRGNDRKTVVDSVSLHVSEGEILGFLGRNGAGKTTSIKMMAGLVERTSGTVSVLGEDPGANPQTRRHIGAVLEGSRNIYWHFTALENIEYFGALRGIPRKTARREGSKLLELFELGNVDKLQVGKFSRGMQQKVAIAVALLHRPRLLLLDEPTLALDVESAQQVRQIIRQIAQQGQAILLTSHQLDVVEELADRVAIIDQGRILVQEPTRELLSRFAGRAFRIELHGELPPETKRRLASMGVEFNSHRLLYRGEAPGLYRVLQELEPLPIRSIRDDGESLTNIFLEVIRARGS